MSIFSRPAAAAPQSASQALVNGASTAGARYGARAPLNLKQASFLEKVLHHSYIKADRRACKHEAALAAGGPVKPWHKPGRVERAVDRAGLAIAKRLGVENPVPAAMKERIKREIASNTGPYRDRGTGAGKSAFAPAPSLMARLLSCFTGGRKRTPPAAEEALQRRGAPDVTFEAAAMPSHREASGAGPSPHQHPAASTSRKAPARPPAFAPASASASASASAQVYRPIAMTARAGLGSQSSLAPPQAKPSKLAKVAQRVQQRLKPVHYRDLKQQYAEFTALPSIAKAKAFLAEAARYRPGLTHRATVRQARAEEIRSAMTSCRQWLDDQLAQQVDTIDREAGIATHWGTPISLLAARARQAELLWAQSTPAGDRRFKGETLIRHVDGTPALYAYPLPESPSAGNGPHWGHALMPSYIAGLLRDKADLDLPIPLLTPARIGGKPVALTDVLEASPLEDPAELSVRDQQRVAIAQLLAGHLSDGWTSVRRDELGRLQLAGLDRPRPPSLDTLNDGRPALFHPLKESSDSPLLDAPMDPALRRAIRKLDLEKLATDLDQLTMLANTNQKQRAYDDGVRTALYAPAAGIEKPYFEILQRLKAAVLANEPDTPFVMIWADMAADIRHKPAMPAPGRVRSDSARPGTAPP